MNEQKEIVKTDTGEIIPASPMALTLADTMELGQVLAESGMFPDCKNKAQAVAKILLGRELGLSPVYSLQKIYVVQGRLQIGYELVASRINTSHHYRYVVDETTDNVCRITFLRDGQPIGVSQFAMQDAQKAGLVKAESNWVKWPDIMLFARAITQGARKFCPELLAGTEILEESGRDLSPRGEVSREGEPPPSAWMGFWAAARKRGYLNDEDVHAALKIESLKQWLAQGKTLDEALHALPDKVAEKDSDELFGAGAVRKDTPAAPTAPTAPPVQASIAQWTRIAELGKALKLGEKHAIVKRVCDEHALSHHSQLTETQAQELIVDWERMVKNAEEVKA